MADAKSNGHIEPFTDAQLKGIEGWCENIEKAKVPIVYAQTPIKTTRERRFLATIEEYKKALDSAMRQVSALNRGNIADRKRIEGLEDRLEECKVMPDYDIGHTAGMADGFKIKGALDKHIADQPAVIERLRGALERILKIQEKGQNHNLPYPASVGDMERGYNSCRERCQIIARQALAGGKGEVK